MIILTGAAGFIGSHVAEFFQKDNALICVDKPDHFRSRGYSDFLQETLADWVSGDPQPSRHKVLDRQYFLPLLQKIKPEPVDDETRKLLADGDKIEAVFHIGACTDTSQDRDPDFLKIWNIDYSKSIWNWCADNKVPLLYASSAATYGGGEHGFSDAHAGIEKLKPLNPYAISKHQFDLWALEQAAKGHAPPNWYAMKFFNVFGEQEGHKGAMASPVYHSFHYIQKHGKGRLFKSHHPDYKDGEQTRDFIYVHDIVQLMNHLWQNRPASGVYNFGTGKGRTFHDLMKALFAALDKPLEIEWVETPQQYRAAYQYFTEADLSKLSATANFDKEFTSLESAVLKYCRWLQKQ